MNHPPPHAAPGPVLKTHARGRRAVGFTLVELLVVIGVVALLIALLMPALSRAREHAKRVTCQGNLRSIGQALNAYANTNNHWVPVHAGGGNWLWDLSYGTRDALVRHGATKDAQYCPASTNDEVYRDQYWQYSGDFYVSGYYWMTKRIGGTFPPLIGRQYVSTLTVPNAADAEVAADATISENGDFVKIAGEEGGETNHLRGRRPLGGNVLFADGHVAWRDFSEMKIRANQGVVMFWY